MSMDDLQARWNATFGGPDGVDLLRQVHEGIRHMMADQPAHIQAVAAEFTLAADPTIPDAAIQEHIDTRMGVDIQVLVEHAINLGGDPGEAMAYAEYNDPDGLRNWIALMESAQGGQDDREAQNVRA